MYHFNIYDENGKEIQILVEECGNFLNLTPKGFGQCVSLDYYKGQLRVIINNKEHEEGNELAVVLDKEEAESV